MMTNALKVSVLAPLLMLLCGGTQVPRQAERCGAAIDGLTTARAVLYDSVHAYATCIDMSVSAKSDCSDRFESLDEARPNFERGIARFRRDC